MLAGHTIPFHYGFIAHSDGDVIIHAIIDALLGAANLGDIGELFPDNDPQFKNIDSRILLKRAYEKIQTKAYHINNIDVTVMAEMPKLKPYKSSMAALIAQDLNIDADCVSIKATTTEKLGFTGRGEGIAAQAVVLLSKISI